MGLSGKWLVLVASLLLISFIGLLPESASSDSPHVVIIMADQLRYDVLGTLTPNINLLKAEGVAFNRAYCASPLCTPARGAFFTGNYPNQTGSLINAWGPKDTAYCTVKAGMPNLYQLLENQWDSWHAGKQHFITAERITDLPSPKTRGSVLEKDYGAFLKKAGHPQPGGSRFKADAPEEVSGGSTTLLNYSIPETGVYKPGIDYFFDGYILKTSLQALRERDKAKPLLLNAMFLAPHPPFNIPEPYFSKIKSTDLPRNVGHWSKFQSPLQLHNATGFLGGRYDREDWAKIWPIYLGLVSLLDDAVGQLVAELKQQGIYDNTLIVFTSDHGEMLGSHRLWQKMCMYEESARIPLIIKFPKNYQPKTREINEPVSHIDVLPTLMDFLNIPLPKPVAGQSLMPVIAGKPVNPKPVFIQYDGNRNRGHFQRCVVEGDYKLIVDTFKDERFLELYNVRQDPQEEENLAFRPDQKEHVLTLLSQLTQHMKATGDLFHISRQDYNKVMQDYTQYVRQVPK